MTVVAKLVLAVLALMALPGCETAKREPTAEAFASVRERVKPAPVPDACKVSKGKYALREPVDGRGASMARFADGTLTSYGKLLADHSACASWVDKQLAD